MIARIFFSAVVLSGIASPALAVGIQPLRLEITAGAEAPASGKLTVTNSKSEPVRIQIQTGPYRYAFSAYSIPPANPADRQMPSCESWIRLALAEVTLPAGQSADFTFTLDVPEGAFGGAGGEYVAALLVDERPVAASASEEGTGKLTILPRVAIPLYVFIQGKDDLRGQLLSFGVETGPAAGIAKFMLGLGNEGKIHVRPSGTLLVADEQKKIVHRGGLGKTVPIFPRFQERIPIWVPLQPGRYTAVATVDFGGPELMQREIAFEVTLDGHTHE
ncbi:MAG: hypothetical protein HY594_00305 [Candidatus Omnitrophica bacterium]|nr:hypothetical protein [Candidatus Omnitrophota bacterium]